MRSILRNTDKGPEIWLTGFVVQNEDKEFYEWYGYDAVCPRDVVDVLCYLGGKPVTVKIDGYGGSMYAGSTIYTEFMSYSGAVTFIISGLAASALSTIAMASAKEGNRCLMSPMAMMMIHNAQGGRDGDYRDMEYEAGRLRAANKTAVNAYQIKTGLSVEKIQELMDADTLLDAKTCLDLGLVDEIMFTDDFPEEIQAPTQVMNAMSHNYRTLYNSVPVPSRQALEAFQAAKPVPVPESPPPENLNFQIAQAALKIEQQRYGGKTNEETV